MAQRPKWKKLLDPFEDDYLDMHKGLSDKLGRMSIAELREVIEATKNRSATNCSWSMYRVAGIVREEAEWWMTKRKKEQVEQH